MLSIPSSTILHLRQRYTIQDFIGEGNIGGVWKVQNGEGLFYTLKIFYKINFHNPAYIDDLLKRIAIVQKIEHEHILPIIEYGLLPLQETGWEETFSPMLIKEEWQQSKIADLPHAQNFQSLSENPEKNKKSFLLMPFVLSPYSENNLEQLMQNEKFDEWQRMELSLQLALGIRKIHSYLVQSSADSANHVEPFFHGNLRPCNILIFNKGERKIAKIADLGFGSPVSDYPEIAPEQKQQKNTNYLADLFSLSKILQQLFQQPHSEIEEMLKSMQDTEAKKRPDLGRLVVVLWNERKRMYNHQLAYTVYLLGVNIYQKGYFDYALKDFQKALALNPNLVAAWVYQGNTQRELGQSNEAMSSYNQAITLDNNNALAYENRAELYGEQNDLPKAIADFEKAIELDPSAASAYGSLGLIYTQMQNWEKALEQFDKLLSYKQDFGNAYVDRANVLVELSRYSEALQDYRKAIELKCEDDTIASKIEAVEKKIATA